MANHTTQMLSTVLGISFDESSSNENVDYSESLVNECNSKDRESSFSPLRLQSSLEFMKNLCISSLLNLLKKEYNKNTMTTSDALELVEDVPVELWVTAIVNKLELQ
eukprot:NODE_9_length_47730_cov_0.323718.p32 type:complete len:107 gc:universal NODE_9_length_47730_cov_0.323718:22193-22513(+)